MPDGIVSDPRIYQYYTEDARTAKRLTFSTKQCKMDMIFKYTSSLHPVPELINLKCSPVGPERSSAGVMMSGRFDFYSLSG